MRDSCKPIIRSFFIESLINVPKSSGEKFPTFSCGSGKLSFFLFLTRGLGFWKVEIDVFYYVA